MKLKYWQVTTAVFSLLALGTQVAPGTVTWDGGGNDLSWNNPLNWNTDSLPGPADDVVIPDQTPDVVISHDPETTSVNSLTSAEELILLGSFSIAQESVVHAPLSIQTLEGTGDLTVHGLLSITGGALATSGETNALGGISINNGFVTGGTLVNHGTATWAQRNFGVQDGAVFENLDGATFDIQSDGYGGNVEGVFNNAGRVVKSAGSGTSALYSVFNNNDGGGDIEIQTGILLFGGGGVTNTPITFQGTAGVGFGRTFTLDADLEVPGELLISGGILAGTGNVTVHGLLTLGRLRTSGVTEALGGISINNGFVMAGTLVNHGTATWMARNFGVQDGAVFENLEGATFDIQSDGYGGNVEGVFNNAGRVVKSAGGGTSALYSVFNNNGGDIEAKTGILLFGGGITQVGGTSIVHLSDDYGKFAVSGSLNPSGTLQVGLSNGFTPSVGDTFIVFDNDGTDAVGTAYDGLPEGASFFASGALFQISYSGGAGNDIELTAVEADPVVLLEGLAQQVIVLNLHHGTEKSLLAKLDNALKKLEDRNSSNDMAAINTLKAFINEVEAQRGKKISNTDADPLIAAANDIIAVLSEL